MHNSFIFLSGTDDRRTCHEFRRDIQTHTQQTSDSLMKSSHAICFYVMPAHCFRYYQRDTSVKLPGQIFIPIPIIFLISCFIALTRDTTLSISFRDLALFSYTGSDHAPRVLIVRVSWASSQSPPKPIELVASSISIYSTSQELHSNESFSYWL